MLIDFLNFTFGSGFWRFAGVTLLLLIAAAGLVGIGPSRIGGCCCHDRED